jgi:hypothetical protein
MISPIAPEPTLAANAHMADHRQRAAPQARPMLHGSAQKPPGGGSAHNDHPFTPDERQPPAAPESAPRDNSAIFAAAVIAGALPPTPRNMAELVLRIGISTIPAESEARLKDLLA